MKVDKALLSLIEEMQGQLNVLPYGEKLTKIFKASYQLGTSIQQATLLLVNELFNAYGLLTLIPDNASLKHVFNDVVKNELTTQFSHPLVEQTAAELAMHYKVQASGRNINLFYLMDDVRERIEKHIDAFEVVNCNKQWTESELLQEVNEHPERFSSNVILRGVFQEMILPNVAFIGGGGEIAYWLELKKVFQACDVAFPVLVLRNSFINVNDEQQFIANKLGFKLGELFASFNDLMNIIVTRNNEKQLTLVEEKNAIKNLYLDIETTSAAIDITLQKHVKSLQAKQLKLLVELEKKMLRAEKRKYADQQQQLQKLKNQLFPNNSLQERVDNFAYYYARYGNDWIQELYKASCTLEQQFCILNIK